MPADHSEHRQDGTPVECTSGAQAGPLPAPVVRELSAAGLPMMTLEEALRLSDIPMSAAEVEEPAGPGLSPVRVHVSDEPPPYEVSAREPAVVLLESEVKAPNPDGNVQFPLRLVNLIAD